MRTEFRRRYFAITRPFFGHRSDEFHALLDAYDVIVSGSVALAFFSWADTWEPGDMDLYVGVDSYSRFIAALEGSQLAMLAVGVSPRTCSADYRGIKDVRRYVTSTGQHMDVIQSTTNNPAHPLLFFWSSVVVNFLTPRAAVCVFPRSTLSHEGFVTDLTNSPKLLEARDKYEDRGFSFTEVRSWRPIYQPDRGDVPLLSDRPVLIVPLFPEFSFHSLELPISSDARGCMLAPRAPAMLSGGKVYYSSSSLPCVDFHGSTQTRLRVLPCNLTVVRDRSDTIRPRKISVCITHLLF